MRLKDVLIETVTIGGMVWPSSNARGDSRGGGYGSRNGGGWESIKDEDLFPAVVLAHETNEYGFRYVHVVSRLGRKLVLSGHCKVAVCNNCDIEV